VVEVVVSAMDAEHFRALRQNVNDFLARAAATYAAVPGRLLDVAPQVHEGARPFFPAAVSVETLDIDPKADCTYTGDICETNRFLADGTFDYVVCTEVLEHTLRPFDAVNEIWRLLKADGWLFVSVPFNFRIHGPLPDCWRFTEHGLRAILSRFMIVELRALETPGRDLMPIHYTVVARKPRG
jgi:SAM-dependent methyltransferase